MAAAARKSDLLVRTASAVVMLAVAGTALWWGGTVFTFFVALGTITVLMKLIRHMSFLPFAVYRVALGVILLAVIYSGIPLGAVN